MRKLSKEQVLLLHTQLIEEFGGTDGVRDYNLLDSALETPFQSFAGEELYPTIQAKAARLGYGLIKNHSCDAMVNSVQTEINDAEIIDRIRKYKKKDIDELVYKINHIKAYHHKRIKLFYILFSRFDYNTYENKWRRPYLYYDGRNFKSYSDILFINKNGKRKYQLWWLRNSKEADIWTYLFYSEIEAHNENRIEEDSWWLYCFMRERCYSDSKSDELLLEAIKMEGLGINH